MAKIRLAILVAMMSYCAAKNLDFNNGNEMQSEGLTQENSVKA